MTRVKCSMPSQVVATHDTILGSSDCVPVQTHHPEVRGDLS